MSKSEPRFFEHWDGPLLPPSAFYEYYSRDYTWEPRVEYVIPLSLDERVVMTIERGSAGHLDMKELARYDTLAENDIWDASEDAKELADKLMSTLFYHMSDFELMHIMNKMAERCRIDQDFTKEFYATLPPPESLPQCSGEQENERQEGL